MHYLRTNPSDDISETDTGNTDYFFNEEIDRENSGKRYSCQYCNKRFNKRLLEQFCEYKPDEFCDYKPDEFCEYKPDGDGDGDGEISWNLQ